MFRNLQIYRAISNLSLRYKLAAVVAIAIIGLSMINGMIQMTSQKELVHDVQFEHGSLVIDVLSQQIAAPIHFRDVSRIEGLMHKMSGNDALIRTIDVYDVNGDLLASFNQGESRHVAIQHNIQGASERRSSETDVEKELIDSSIIMSKPIFAKAGGDVVGMLVISWDISEVQHEMQSNIIQLITTNAGAALIVLMVVVWVLGRLVTRPVQALNVSMQRIANRDYESGISVSLRGDEVGQMAEQLTKLRDQLQDEFRQRVVREEKAVQQQVLFQRLADGLSDLAEGRVDQQIELEEMGELDDYQTTVCESFNAVSAKLRNVLSTITSTAESVRNSAAEIADVAVDQSKRSEAQAVTLEESAAAIETLSASVNQTAERAAEANERILLNRKQAQSGDEVVSLAVEAMKSIEQSSEQITAIIGVIDDIAFQTNLLALNAGVEAARAGEAGRGFAVVASEVRALAQRASESANEIKELIMRSGEQVANGSELVNKAGAALSEIIDGVHYASDLVSMIATSSREQADNLTEIKESVTELDQVTQQNAAVIEESSAASRSLSEEAARMTEVLEMFTSSGRIGKTTSQAWDEDLAADQAEAVRQTHAVNEGELGKAEIIFTSRSHSSRKAVNQSEDWQDF